MLTGTRNGAENIAGGKGPYRRTPIGPTRVAYREAIACINFQNCQMLF